MELCACAGTLHAVNLLQSSTKKNNRTKTFSDKQARHILLKKFQAEEGHQFGKRILKFWAGPPGVA